MRRGGGMGALCPDRCRAEHDEWSFVRHTSTLIQFALTNPNLNLTTPSNSRLPELYAALGRDLDVMEPKLPEDVYKMHLVEGRVPTGGQGKEGAAGCFWGCVGENAVGKAVTVHFSTWWEIVVEPVPVSFRPGPRRLLYPCQSSPLQGKMPLLTAIPPPQLHPQGPAVDSARANLSATFVNGLVNAGFGKDKLVTPGVEDDAVHWVFKNKDHGKLSAAASLGLVMLWDLEGGLPAIDRFLYSNDPHVVAGALLGIGVLSCGVADEVDPALAILSEYVGGAEAWPRIGAALGLGVAYAGRGRADVADLLAPMVADPDTPMEATVAAALGLGLAFAGRAHGGAVEAALQALMLRGEAELAHPFGTMLALALGLLFLRTGEAVEATLEVVRTLPPALAEPTLATLRACAYAGTGDVLHVQALLAIAGGAGGGAEGAAGAGGGAAPATAAAAGAKAPPALQSTIAVLGVAMVASGEELGTAMAYRALEHLLQYGEPSVRWGCVLFPEGQGWSPECPCAPEGAHTNPCETTPPPSQARRAAGPGPAQRVQPRGGCDGHAVSAEPRRGCRRGRLGGACPGLRGRRHQQRAPGRHPARALLLLPQGAHAAVHRAPGPGPDPHGQGPAHPGPLPRRPRPALG